MLPSPVSPKSNEWFTPYCYIEAARKVLGSIDLDPASCALANQTVRASRYYTREDDGLIQDWYGNMWVNPPYGKHPVRGKSNMSLFTHRLLYDYNAGTVHKAILLVTAVPDRKWFAPLWDYPICFPDHQIVFNMPNGAREHHPYGSCFVYFGPHEDHFIEVFQEFGPIAKRVSLIPPSSSSQLTLL